MTDNDTATIGTTEVKETSSAILWLGNTVYRPGYDETVLALHFIALIFVAWKLWTLREDIKNTFNSRKRKLIRSLLAISCIWVHLFVIFNGAQYLGRVDPALWSPSDYDSLDMLAVIATVPTVALYVVKNHLYIRSLPSVNTKTLNITTSLVVVIIIIVWAIRASAAAFPLLPGFVADGIMLLITLSINLSYMIYAVASFSGVNGSASKSFKIIATEPRYRYWLFWRYIISIIPQLSVIIVNDRHIIDSDPMVLFVLVMEWYLQYKMICHGLLKELIKDCSGMRKVTGKSEVNSATKSSSTNSDPRSNLVAKPVAQALATSKLDDVQEEKAENMV